MEAYRIALEQYSRKLVASGAPNRWNTKGQMVLYAGGSRSLATLELVVHRGVANPGATYKVMVLHIADDDNLITQIKRKDLPPGWRSMAGYNKLQQMGSKWYHAQESLVLKVPSAVIEREHNYVINTLHPDFDDNVRLVTLEEYYWDNRLL